MPEKNSFPWSSAFAPASYARGEGIHLVKIYKEQLGGSNFLPGSQGKPIHKSTVTDWALDKLARDAVSIFATNQLCDLTKLLSLVHTSVLFPSLLMSGFLSAKKKKKVLKTKSTVISYPSLPTNKCTR